MKVSQELMNALENYRETLREYGSATAEVITPGSIDTIEILNELKDVTIPESLKTFYLFIGKYDDDKIEELDLYEPHFAWDMYLVPLDSISSHYKDCAGCGGTENPDYWPLGFVPILQDGSGSYVVINCLSGSPTYGGVYDMSEGVGCNLISKSLLDFIIASENELKEGIRVFTNSDFSDTPNYKTYLSDSSRIFGNTPYFSRFGKMDQQIVDWR